MARGARLHTEERQVNPIEKLGRSVLVESAGKQNRGASKALEIKLIENGRVATWSARGRSGPVSAPHVERFSEILLAFVFSS
jgi:DNA-binding protein H-NS